MSQIEINEEFLDLRKNRPRIPHFHLTHRTQVYRNKKSIEIKMNTVQEFCRKIGLEIHTVIIKSINPIQINKINYQYIDELNDNNETKRAILMKALKAKDEANCSDIGYHKFRQNLKPDIKIPTLRGIVKTRKQLDNLFEIQLNEYGVYNKPRQKN